MSNESIIFNPDQWSFSHLCASSTAAVQHSKYPWHIITASNFIHQRLDTLHKRQMRRVLLQIVFPILLALELDHETMRVYCLHSLFISELPAHGSKEGE